MLTNPSNTHYIKVESLKSGKGGGNTSSMDDLDKTLEAEMKAQVLKAQVFKYLLSLYKSNRIYV